MSRIFLIMLALQAALAPSPLSQTAGPTVGDTIWLSRTIPVPSGNVVRAADWEPADPIELLGRPRISITGDSAKISYPIVIWRPGQHVIEVPGPLLLGPGGTVDSLAGQQVRLLVRSVLPPVPQDSLRPQPRASLVAWDEVNPVPLIILWLLALVLLVPLHLWWRRRGKPPADSVPETGVPEAPLDRWADAGESRAVINIASLSLRSVLAQRVAAAQPGLDTEQLLAELAKARPNWPLEELREVLRALDDARFGLIPASDAMELSRSTFDLRDRLLREAA